MSKHLGLTLEDVQSGIGDVWSKPANLPDVGTPERRAEILALEGEWVAYGCLRALPIGDRFAPESWRHLPSGRYISGSRQDVYDIVSDWIVADVADVHAAAFRGARPGLEERVIMRIDVHAPDRSAFTVLDQDVTALVLRLMTGTDVKMERLAHQNSRRMIAEINEKDAA